MDHRYGCSTTFDWKVIRDSYLSRDEIQSIYTVTPVSLTTADDIIRTSSRVEIEMGCLGGLKVHPLVMDSPCVLSAGLLVAAGFGLT
eukprot:5277417-Amphidinium_carterae.1